MRGKKGCFGTISHLQKYHFFLFVNPYDDQYFCIINTVMDSKAENLNGNIIITMKDQKIYMEKKKNAFQHQQGTYLSTLDSGKENKKILHIGTINNLLQYKRKFVGFL